MFVVSFIKQTLIIYFLKTSLYNVFKSVFKDLPIFESIFIAAIQIKIREQTKRQIWIANMYLIFFNFVEKVLLSKPIPLVHFDFKPHEILQAHDFFHNFTITKIKVIWIIR